MHILLISASKRAKIAIFGYFDPKIESSELGAKNAFIVTTGLISSRKMFLNCFQSIFFEKKSKITFFHWFDPKFVVFSKIHFGVIFSVNFI